MLIRKSILPGFCLLSFIFLNACNSRENAGAGTGDEVINYPVITIQPRSTTLQSLYPATIEGQQDIEIRPKIDGYVEAIYIDEGDLVKLGQPLFKINAPQYEQEVRTAKAAIKIAQANVNTAQMEVNKIKPLVEKNIISNYELDAAEFALESRQAELAQAEATLANASTNLNYTEINSPVTGIVGTLPYKIGSLVNSNTSLPLTRVSNTQNIFAYFSVNEKQVLELSAQSSGNIQNQLTSMPSVYLTLADGSRYSRPGKVDATSGSINTATGSIRLRATFPNPDGRIKSGSSGVVIIPLALDSAIVIPQKATYEIQGKKFVYTVDKDHIVHSQAIEVMDNNDGQFYVVSQGLKAGDAIILEGLGSVRDEVEVLPEPVNADSLYRAVNPN